MTRRQALRHSLLFLAGSPWLRAQQGLPYTREPRQALEDLVDVFDFEPLCKAKIPKLSYDFIAGGVDNEWTLRHNREAFEAITFRPHMLAGVQNLDLSLDLFGQRIEMPILIAPTGSQGLAHQQGEIAMARAAGAVKTIMVVSNNSSYPLEKIAAAATGPLWFQHYPAENSREQVERAVSLGCKAVCITVDTTYDSHRERLLRGGESERVPGGVPGEPRRGQPLPARRALYRPLAVALRRRSGLLRQGAGAGEGPPAPRRCGPRRRKRRPRRHRFEPRRSVSRVRSPHYRSAARDRRCRRQQGSRDRR